MKTTILDIVLSLAIKNKVNVYSILREKEPVIRICFISPSGMDKGNEEFTLIKATCGDKKNEPLKISSEFMAKTEIFTKKLPVPASEIVVS